MTSDAPLLQVEDLITSFPLRGRLFEREQHELHAVAGVSFEIRPGQTLGLVGESGCGKSTVARSIVGLEKPRSGSIVFDGRDLLSIRPREFRRVSRDIQLVFQDPYSSLYPRMTVRQILTEPWQIHRGVMARGDWDKEVGRLLEMVGLSPEYADRYAHQFSGGQRQRICIARALALRPKLILCDEITSALDVSIQAQILNLLRDLQEQLGLAYLFISHDLSVVRHVSDEIAVMYLGKIVESGSRAQIFHGPTHPYTQALLSGAPAMRPWRASRRERIVLQGDLPSSADPPSGCRFRTRCWKSEPICGEEEPALDLRGHDHPSACFFAEPDTAVIPHVEPA